VNTSNQFWGLRVSGASSSISQVRAQGCRNPPVASWSPSAEPISISTVTNPLANICRQPCAASRSALEGLVQLRARHGHPKIPFSIEETLWSFRKGCAGLWSGTTRNISLRRWLTAGHFDFESATVGRPIDEADSKHYPQDRVSSDQSGSKLWVPRGGVDVSQI